MLEVNFYLQNHYMYASIPPVAEKMSCLLPQFKCLPDSFSIQFKSHNHHSPQLPKHRDPTFSRTRCILSTTAPPALTESTVLNLEKLQLSSLEVHSTSGGVDRPWSSSSSSTTAGLLDIESFQLPSLESHTNSIAGSRPWASTGAVGPSMEGDIGATLPSEFVTSEDAVVAAAASEAIALARAAVKVAKDAASMMTNHHSTSLDFKPTPNLLSDNSVNQTGSQTSDEVEPTIEELELLQAQLSASITVRSKRQVERKAKRMRAAERAAEASVVAVKCASTIRRRRATTSSRDKKDKLNFLKAMTSGPKELLTGEEEVKLSEGIQDLLKLEDLRKKLTERFGVPPTSAEWAAAAGVDQKMLFRRLNHGTFCRDKMVKSNIRLVISIAKNYQGTAVNIQDIVQEGCRGLLRSAEKFDASKGFKFSTYAHWWIKQAVRKSLSDHSRIIRFPVYMVGSLAKLKEARRQLSFENGRDATDEEVSAATGISVKRIQALDLAPPRPRSFDAKTGIDLNLKHSDIIHDPEAETPDEIFIKQCIKQDLEKVLDALNEKERQVIRWRYGLEDGVAKTLQEIGDVLGVSRERVRQVELSAFRKLKNKKRTHNLQHYFPE